MSASTMESLGRASSSTIFLLSSFSIETMSRAKKVLSSTSLIMTRSTSAPSPSSRVINKS